jgi:hypothetical protein
MLQSTNGEKMSIKPMKRSLAAIAAVVALGAMGSVAPAGADEVSSTQQEINETLAATKGGVQISPYEIAWNGGEAVMAFPLPGETSAPPSSEAAQKLQTKVSGVPANTRETEPGMQPPAASKLARVATGVAAANAQDSDVSIQAADTCPTQAFGNDWYCFYQDANFGGRRLQWNAAHKYPDDVVYFYDYAFNNMASSWSNKGGKSIHVRGRKVAGDDTSCYGWMWDEQAHERSAAVVHNDEADCFWTS